MLSLFKECIIVFQAPAQFPKIYSDVSNTTVLSITVNSGCSSYIQRERVASWIQMPSTLLDPNNFRGYLDL